MAITRKPKHELAAATPLSSAPSINEKAALDFIGKAAVNQHKEGAAKEQKRMLTIHLLESEIARIDALLGLKTGRDKLSRRAWITKAILERLETEEK